MRSLDPDDRSLERLRLISEPRGGRWQTPAGDEQQSGKRASDDDKIAGYGHAYRSCKLSNLGSPTTAIQLRKCGARTSIPKLLRRRGTSLPPAFKPCCDYSCPNMHP